MHQPPRGPGYGAPHPPGGYGHGGGPGPYGGPPYPPPPYGGGYGGPPPPKAGPNIALIVLIVLVGGLVVLGGGCAVCVLLAGSAKTTDTDAAADPILGSGERTIERTPLAKKLEVALKADKIPVDYVECPVSPPSAGTFSCAVIPTSDGDPAEVIVTIAPSGMTYRLQEGFVLLEGTKLATMFAGIAAQTKPSRLRVPCFQGTIMKHVDTSFTCEVTDGSAVVGHVTTTVVDKTGAVKMDYEPATTGKSAPPPSGGTRILDGTYACIVSGFNPGGGVQIRPSPLPRFTISAGAYSTSNGGGSVSSSGDVLSFNGGPYDGWQGLAATNASGRYVQFRGTDHAHAMPGVPTKMGDHQCYVQK